ncbi:MAG: hypothetical protein RLZZ606_527 [Actinomycetota bacterium]
MSGIHKSLFKLLVKEKARSFLTGLSTCVETRAGALPTELSPRSEGHSGERVLPGGPRRT